MTLSVGSKKRTSLVQRYLDLRSAEDKYLEMSRVELNIYPTMQTVVEVRSPCMLAII